MYRQRKWIIGSILFWFTAIALIPYYDRIGLHTNSIDVFPYYDWRVCFIALYPLALGFWFSKLKCRSCGAPQVLRGHHVTKMRLPGKVCWVCGCTL